MSSPKSTERILRFDVFELDVHAGELRKRGVKLRLQGQPLRVLATLLKRAGDLVTREELRAELWTADTFVDFDHSLHNAIARIREVLGDSAGAPRYVETLPRRGYRFMGRVDAASSEASVGATGRKPKLEHRQIQSVAVLPLEDLSGERSQEYFADSMTEALITSLAKVGALRVISRTSAMRYKGTRKSLPQIGRELNVDAVIEGSVTRSGHRVRINAQLIHATSDQHLWAESYERDFRDILTLQSEIARQVANQVRIVLTPEESARLGETRQVNPEAHECYLKARYYWNKRTEESVKKALSNFHKAIDSDPTYAQGYAGVADCYNILGYYSVLAPSEAYPMATAAAKKAMVLDNSLAEAHAALGVVKRDYEWDWAGAENEFRRAIELSPGYVEGHHWRSTLLSMLGRGEEGLREKKRALAMDPLSVVIRTDVARMFYFARAYDQSLQEYGAVLDMDPSFGWAHLWMAQAYEQKGLFEEATAALEEGVRLSRGSTFALARLGHGHALAGRRDDAREVLRELKVVSGKKHVSPYDVAMIYAGLREVDRAFTWLQKAFEERSVWLGYLNVEPQLDGLRTDARFRALLAQVGFQ